MSWLICLEFYNTIIKSFIFPTFWVLIFQICNFYTIIKNFIILHKHNTKNFKKNVILGLSVVVSLKLFPKNDILLVVFLEKHYKTRLWWHFYLVYQPTKNRRKTTQIAWYPVPAVMTDPARENRALHPTWQQTPLR